MTMTITGHDEPYAQGSVWVQMVVGLDVLARPLFAGTGWLEAMELELVARVGIRGEGWLNGEMVWVSQEMKMLNSGSDDDGESACGTVMMRLSFEMCPVGRLHTNDVSVVGTSGTKSSLKL